MPFDADSFMQQQVDQPLEVERTIIPPGEYKMTIGDFTSDAFETIQFEYKKGPRAGEPGEMYVFNVPLEIQDDALKAQLHMEGNPRVYYRCTLDIDENGQLQWGPNKNIDLGKLRHAVSQNSPGPWAPSQLRGAGPFMGKVEHREGKRKDGTKFKIAEVVRMAPAR